MHETIPVHDNVPMSVFSSIIRDSIGEPSRSKRCRVILVMILTFLLAFLLKILMFAFFFFFEEDQKTFEEAMMLVFEKQPLKVSWTPQCLMRLISNK